MVYGTKGIVMRGFLTQDDAELFIKKYLESSKLSYKLFSIEKKDNTETRVYQYSTSRYETFTIHTEKDNIWGRIYE